MTTAELESDYLANMHMGHCAVCGVPIEIWDHSTPRKYCGKICKGAAKKRRHAEKINRKNPLTQGE